MKRILFVIGILMFSLPLQAQQSKWLEQARAAFSQRDYVDAVRFYEKAVRKTKNFESQKVLGYQIGRCYYKMKDYAQARRWFEDAVGNQIDSLNAYWYLSEILMIENQFDHAIGVLQKAKRLHQADQEIENRIQNIRFIQQNILPDSLSIVRPVNVLNSSMSDYGLAWWGGKLVFTSTRQPKFSNTMDGRTGQGFSNLYFASKTDDGRIGQISRMAPVFNTGYNDGTFAFDSVHQVAYWTSCSEHSRHCVLVQSKYSTENERWGRPEKLSFMLAGYNYGHPDVSSDGNTLYFISNMPGGFGKNDLWRISRLQDGAWGIPVNLGHEVNSKYNELFPQMVGDSLLFFASDRPGALGGLDLYYSLKQHNDLSAPSPLPYPLNSPADDFALLMNPSGRGGYFCSNRNLKTSDDIYHFDGFPVKVVVEGNIQQKYDGKPIDAAKVIFRNSKARHDTVSSDKKGRYRFLVNAMDDYLITATKPGYFIEKRTFSTRSALLLKSPRSLMRIDFVLEKKDYPCAIEGWVKARDNHHPMPGLKVRISTADGFSSWVLTDARGLYRFDGLKPNTMYTVKTGHDGYFSESRVCTLPKVHRSEVFSKANGYDMDFELTRIQTKREVILSNIYYDFDKASLRVSSKIELNKLASMLRETPGVVIQINAHTDSRGSDAYNLRLSRARAQAVVDYLVSQGIDANRLVAKGWGETQPLIPNAKTDDEFQANRRTSFKILAVRPVNQSHIASVKREIPSVNASAAKKSLSAGKSKVTAAGMGAELVYRVQIMVSSKWISTQYGFESLKKQLPHTQIYRVATAPKLYKYEVGNRYHFKEIKQLQTKLKRLGYKDCFVVAYYQGKRIKSQKAIQLEKGGRL
jgi:outer membrane protein OmpA-like peptidoglycan-associated protein